MTKILLSVILVLSNISTTYAYTDCNQNRTMYEDIMKYKQAGYSKQKTKQFYRSYLKSILKGEKLKTAIRYRMIDIDHAYHPSINLSVKEFGEKAYQYCIENR